MLHTLYVDLGTDDTLPDEPLDTMPAYALDYCAVCWLLDMLSHYQNTTWTAISLVLPTAL